jgi:hypothetical protein
MNATTYGLDVAEWLFQRHGCARSMRKLRRLRLPYSICDHFNYDIVWTGDYLLIRTTRACDRDFVLAEILEICSDPGRSCHSR